MPKIVDHDQRRAEIVDAAMRVIRRVGVEKTTVREIAKEAGCSKGVLAHYFDNKDEILVMAHHTAFADASKRIQARIGDTTSIDALRSALHEALPLDEEREREAFVDVAFWGQAILDDKLRAVRTESHNLAVAKWSARLAELRAAGVVTNSSSDEQLATDIMLLVDGLSAQALLHPEVMTPDAQRAAIERFLARLQTH